MLLCCPGLHHRPHANALGRTFAQDFATNSTGLGKGEITLFQAMHKSMEGVAKCPEVVVEEYHGSNHQVTFTGTGTYSRTAARCELSDLLVVVYDRQTMDARLSYIQAKSERIVAANACGIAGSRLTANLEQWDLLARRPRISGVGSFRPPPDLLSSAPLASVGSFVFFLHGAGGVEIQYAAASNLQRPPQSVSRNGRLIAGPDRCQCDPSPECLSVYGNADFGVFLFGLMIGTPILTFGKPGTKSVCSWLAGQLRGFAAQAAMADTRAELASELADRLDPDRAPAAEEPNVGAASFLIVGIGSPDARND